MYSFSYGGKTGQRYSLLVSEDRVAVRTHSRARVVEDAPYSGIPISADARDVLGEFEPELRLPEAGIQVLKARSARKRTELRDRAREILKKEPEVRFAGRVLCEAKSKAPVLYTENLFLKFDDDTKPAEHRKVCRRFGLAIKRALDYARNAYFPSPRAPVSRSSRSPRNCSPRRSSSCATRSSSAASAGAPRSTPNGI